MEDTSDAISRRTAAQAERLRGERSGPEAVRVFLFGLLAVVASVLAVACAGQEGSGEPGSSAHEPTEPLPPLLLRPVAPGEAGTDLPQPRAGRAGRLRQQLLILSAKPLRALAPAAQGGRQPAPDALRLRLFEDVEVELVDLNVEGLSPSSFRVTGAIRGRPDQRVILIVHDGTVRANLTLDRRLFEVVPARGRWHWAVEIDLDSYPPDG